MKIVIADDDVSTRTGAIRIFKAAGHEVRDFPNGMQLLDYLSGQPHVDIIVTDFSMPGMTGLQVVRNIRTMTKYANVPLVVWTAEEELREQVAEAGAIFAGKGASPSLSEVIKRLTEKLAAKRARKSGQQ